MLKELGIQGVINATGTLTVLGGSVVDKEILGAMAEAASVYIDMEELHDKAGKYVAKLTGAEAAYVTSGGGAALALSVAACMTKGDSSKMAQLPRTDEIQQNEIIVQKLHRNQYDYLIEIPGAKIVEVGTDRKTDRTELEHAIGRRTAAVVYFVYDPQEGVLPLDEVLRISHSRGIPVIVDAAAELPPSQNLSRFTQEGGDLVIFSGGKDIGAPNDTGIILGKKELVDACRRLGPHSYERTGSTKTRVYIGRVMKSSKEDIVGFVAALEKYLREDHSIRINRWEKRADNIVRGLADCPSIKATKTLVTFGHPRPVNFPRVEVEVMDKQLTADEFVQRLRKSKPPVYAYSMNGKLYFNPQCLKDGEDEMVVRAVLSILEKHS
jgi:L-seryl-tRNA(Ser) seleniumtransferase